MKFFIKLPTPLYPILITWFLFIYHVRSIAVERSTYIVHMDKSLMPMAFTSHHHWYASTVDSLAPAGLTSADGSHSKPNLVYTYDNVVHGFCALLSEDELKTMRKSLGFVSAYRDRQVKLRTTHTPKFLSLKPTAGLWPAADYGKDVIIGVVDSGIWPESKSFGDDGMTSSTIPAKWMGICDIGQEFNVSLCNAKLIGARYFNKGIIAQNPNVTFSMVSARDTIGHGTHTASTASGNFVHGVSFFGYAKGTARGVAPRARLAIYKVMWPEGGQSSDYLAGVDHAIADGVDVLSFSFGFDEDLPFYENAIAISTFAAMEKGIVVSHAGGNTGPEYLSLFDSIPWTVTVAAGSIDRSFAGTLELGNGLAITGWSLFPASALVAKLPLNYNKTLASCDSLDLIAEAPYGIIICENTVSNSIFTQLNTLSRSRVAAAIFISDDLEFSTSTNFPLPGVVVSPIDGQTVIKYATSNDRVYASMKFQQTIMGIKPAPAVEDYSSRGPSRTYTRILKPDLLAPGSLVLAAYPPSISVAHIGSGISLPNDYALFSGTSMAAPHVAGVAALLKAVHPEWSAAAIRSAMMTTANPLDNANNPILDKGKNRTFASPLAVGSGHIDPNAALDPGLVYDLSPQEYVNVLCYMNYTANQILTITRSKIYNCSKPSPDINYPSFIAFYPNKTSITKFQTFRRTLTNVGNGAETYNVDVVAPTGSNVTVSPEILVFCQKYEKKSYNLTMLYESRDTGTRTAGSIVWVGENGKHRVRSPIVVSPEVTY